MSTEKRVAALGFWEGGYDAYLIVLAQQYKPAIAELTRAARAAETAADRERLREELKQLKCEYRARRLTAGRSIF